jgi:hypothetical protein
MRHDPPGVRGSTAAVGSGVPLLFSGLIYMSVNVARRQGLGGDVQCKRGGGAALMHSLSYCGPGSALVQLHFAVVCG